jgi:hypothetical protein
MEAQATGVEGKMNLMEREGRYVLNLQKNKR